MIASSVIRRLHRVLQHFVPRRCLLCNLQAAAALCEACVADMPLAANACRHCAARLPKPLLRCAACLLRPPAYSSASAPYDYAFPLDALLARFKYQPDLTLLPALTLLLARSPLRLPDAVMVPVPLHRLRYRQRGFNQSHLLCAYLASANGLQLSHYLRRIRATPPQVTLSKSARMTNLQAAFVAGKAAAGRRICLVDDVITTGATVEAASRALRAAGALSVEVVALARAVQGDRDDQGW